MVQWIGVVLLIIIPAVTIKPVSAAVDATLEQKAQGFEVVRATIRKIRQACIFPNDFGLMRRIAWVESDFGANPNTFRDDSASGGKGIWQLDQIGFDDTKLVDKTKLDELKTNLSVDWSKMTYASANMNVALYNALAARLLLYRKPAVIPPGVSDQAAYWKTYYNTAAGAGTVQGFINKVATMPTCETVGADLLFILDASGSIGSSNFGLMKQVLVDVATKFKIGPDATQIAVVTFDSFIQQRINFTQYSSLVTLTNAITALTYTEGGTNTHLALNLVPDMFRSARSQDAGFPRVVIVLTDGASNDPSATASAAAGLDSISWLERYAVGMGTGINEAELQRIASSPKCSHLYTIQSVSAIAALTDELYDAACRSSAVLPVAEPNSGGHSRMTGTLLPNTPRNVRDTSVSRAMGRTYALQVSFGSATLYVSLSSESPGPALNDFSAKAMPDSPGVVFVSSSVLSTTLLVRRRRQLPSGNSSVSTSGNGTMYLGIVPDAGNQSVAYQFDAYDGDRRSVFAQSVTTPPRTTTNSATGRQGNLLWLELTTAAFVWISISFDRHHDF